MPRCTGTNRTPSDAREVHKKGTAVYKSAKTTFFLSKNFLGVNPEKALNSLMK
jgi:hypothetical protein